MHQDFSDKPTTPLPAAKPPHRRRGVRLRVLLLLTLLVVAGLGIGTILAFVVSSHSQASPAVSNAGRTPAVTAAEKTPTAGTNSLSTPSQPTTPTAGGTAKAGAPSITHGKPHLGGPLTDFVGKYGTPSSQGDVSSASFWVGPSQSIVLNVSSNDQGTVTQIVVIGESAWTGQQTEQYCAQFLPDGAVQKSSSSTLLTYQSSAGTMYLALQATSTCSLLFARS